VQAVLQKHAVEVYQQRDGAIAQVQIGQNLGFMHGQQLRHGFEFQQDPSAHDNVRAVALVELHGFINDRQRNLPPHLHAGLRQLPAEAFLINRFKQAWAEPSMHFYGEADDAIGEAGAGFGCACVHLDMMAGKG
jgi:hypothetical protein